VNFDQRRIDELVAAPSEGLNVEIKAWINPNDPEGVSKLVKAVLAIRNRNGGYLIVGFDDKTLMPDGHHAPENVRASFHLDNIQALVSAYASDAFEIAVGFGLRDGQEHPVIVIPEGVTAPVSANATSKIAETDFSSAKATSTFERLAQTGRPALQERGRATGETLPKSASITERPI
jgi:hypothetical protein